MLQRIKSLPALHILALLLSADAFFVLLHILHKLPFVNAILTPIKDEAFSISRDLGLAESFQYVQELWIVLLLLWLVFHVRKTTYWGWAALYSYFLMDDMFGIHEWLGDHIGPWMQTLLAGTPLADAKMDSVGELLALSAIGLVFLVILYLCFTRSDPSTRRAFRVLTWATIALLFFGVALDFADTFLPSEMLKSILRLIEDGGEMFAMTFMLWFTYLIAGLDPAHEAGTALL